MFKNRFFLKTALLSVLIVGIQFSSFSQVEEITLKAKKNSLKISPTAFAVSTFALSYERYISTSVSVQVTGGLMAASKSTDNPNNNKNFNFNYNSNSSTSIPTAQNDKASGGFVEGMVKFYFLKGKSVMSGLYAAPFARYGQNNFEINRIISNTNYYNSNTNSYTTVTPPFKYTIESMEGGGVFGFQWVVGNAFVMDMYLGGGLKVSNNTAPITYQKSDRSFEILESQDYTGITPRAGLRIGFVF